MQRQIAAGEFKAKCLHLLDEVRQSRQEIVITKRGRAVARLVPVATARRMGAQLMTRDKEVIQYGRKVPLAIF
jgi:prevent-host-death family protein